MALPSHVMAQDASPDRAGDETVRVELGLTFHRFEQQVKQEVGGAAGDRVVEETSFGAQLQASYRVLPFARLGLFAQFDAGTRRAAQLASFDADGAPITQGELGGAFRELWLGPLVRLQWSTLFAEVGWGAFGIRLDDARRDLPNSAGEEGTFRTSPSIAWLFGLGSYVPLRGQWSLALRLQYRIRYYTRRGGRPLANDIVHGTQNFTPFVGIAWRPGEDQGPLSR